MITSDGIDSFHSSLSRRVLDAQMVSHTAVEMITHWFQIWRSCVSRSRRQGSRMCLSSFPTHFNTSFMYAFLLVKTRFQTNGAGCSSPGQFLSGKWQAVCRPSVDYVSSRRLPLSPPPPYSNPFPDSRQSFLGLGRDKSTSAYICWSNGMKEGVGAYLQFPSVSGLSL